MLWHVLGTVGDLGKKKKNQQGITLALSKVQEEFQDQKCTIYRLLDINVTLRVATTSIKWKAVCKKQNRGTFRKK